MSGEWQKKSSKTVYKTSWLELVKDDVVDPEGKQVDYTYLSTVSGVSILALDNHQRIYFVKQYRYPTQTWAWELPGGGAKNKVALEAAKEELHEELMLEANEWELITRIQAFPGTSDEWQHIFVARQLSEKKLEHETDDFPHDARALTWAEVLTWIDEGRINDAQTLGSLMVYQNKFNPK